MLQESTIISTKLQPPRVSDTIHREKLEPLISQFKKKPLITVTAGAGYGKTTFIVNAVRESSVEAVWYRLDKSDTDFITFLHYLAAGVKRVYPDFGAEIFSVINDSQGVNRVNSYLLTLFINELERISNDNFFFVLDDFHLAQESHVIKDAMEFLLKHLPTWIHVIFISRSTIDLPLSRLRSMRAILEIDEKDLQFNGTEIRKLFTEIFNLPIDNDHAKILYEKTKGWISGLVLFYHMLKGKSEADVGAFLKNLRGSRGEIYTYLEENIFDQLHSEEQSFLIKTSILSRLAPDFCNEFLRINSSKEILRSFKENHLFTFQLDDEKEEYIYHDLLKDFFREKLRAQNDKKEIRELYAEAAGIYEKNGEYTTALDMYLESGQMEDVSRLLGMFARFWIKQGNVKKIRSFLKEIPNRYLHEDPWFLFLQAGLMELSDHPQKAIAGYGKALIAFRARSSDRGLNQCLADMAISYFNIGEFEKAEPLFLELLSRKKPSSTLRIICLGYLISLSAYRGKQSDSDAYTEEALSMIDTISDKVDKRLVYGWIYTNVGRRYLIQGRLRDTIEIVEKAFRILKVADGYRAIGLCHILLSDAYYKLGHFDTGLDMAVKLIDMVEEEGFRDGLLASGFFFLAYNYLGLDRLKEAKVYAQKSLKIYREIGVPFGQIKAHALFYRIHFNSGNLKAAENSLHQGMEVGRHINSPLDQAVLEVGLSSVLTEKAKFSKALEMLQSAEGKTRHFGWQRAMVFLGYAKCFFQSNQSDHAVKAFRKGLSLCEEYEYDALLVREKKWIVPLMMDVFTKGEKKDYIRRILIKMGPGTAGELLDILTKSPPTVVRDEVRDLFNELRRKNSCGLKIHFLGKFRIFTGETELPADKWKSKKALQLFKYLVYSRHRGYINKDVLMELLWPEEDPKKSSNSFHVALNAMRKVLEPDLPKSVPSSYILSNKGTYMIDIGENGSVEVEEFSREIEHAKSSTDSGESIDHYLKAISLYTGDFLEEDPYIDWCGDTREGFKEDYLSAIKEVIKFYENQKMFDKCIEFASTYLKTDKYAEEIYQLLMRCYSHLGDNAMGIKTFEKCRQNIMNDLNCPLSRETIDLYQQLNPN